MKPRNLLLIAFVLIAAFSSQRLRDSYRDQARQDALIAQVAERLVQDDFSDSHSGQMVVESDTVSIQYVDRD